MLSDVMEHFGLGWDEVVPRLEQGGASVRWRAGSDDYQADHRDWRYNPLVKSQVGMPPTLVITASLDPIRDQGRAYAAACIQAGVPTIFREARGNIHGFISLRKAIPSSEDDIRGCVAALKLLLDENARR